MYFKDRTEAGQKLSKLLEKYRNQDAVVYALPRGGVILGREVSRELNLPLSLIITRKIGHPLQKEYAVCAIAEDGDMVCNESEKTFLQKEWLEKEMQKERREAKRRREIYLGGKKPKSARGKIAIIVDDGVATGLTMELAIREIKHDNPKRIVVAVPVIPADTAEKFKKEIDELIAIDIPSLYIGSVGSYYDVFYQVEDDEVVKILKSGNDGNEVLRLRKQNLRL